MNPHRLALLVSIVLVAMSFGCEPLPAAGEDAAAEDRGLFEDGEMVGEPGGAGERPRGMFVVTDVEATPPEPVLYSSGGRIFYMNRHGGTFQRGSRNDSSANATTIGSGTSTIAPWDVSDEGWAEVMDCVRDQFARFDVVVTDVDPGDVPHIESVVAGHPGDLGLADNIGGISPFASNCSVIERSVVYTFAELFGDNRQFLCQVVAQEIAHSIGLDHELLCEDPMTYLGGCGAKTFQDIDAPCGESEQRPCACGAATQNSVATLRARLGSAGDAAGSPDVAIVAPRDGDVVDAGFELEVAAFDDDSIDEVRVRIDGVDLMSLAAAPYRVSIDGPLPSGSHTVTVEAIDMTGASAQRSVEVVVAPGADRLADPLGCSAGGGRGGLAGALLLLAGWLAVGRCVVRRNDRG